MATRDQFDNYANPKRDATIELEYHTEHSVIEATLEQDPHYRQQMWASVLTEIDDEYDYDREFVAYCGADDEQDSGVSPIGQGSVIEVVENGAVDEPSERSYYVVDSHEGELDPIEEDEVDEFLKMRFDIFDSRIE